MTKTVFSFLFAITILGSSGTLAQTGDARVTAEKEILAAEAAFCKMAKEQGVAAAFVAFAADDAVLLRDPKVYKGKTAIKEYYEKKDKNDQLSWKPAFVSVSDSYDMGYTYGEYDFSGVRVGKTITDHGMFRTIWKKQKDGSWKFVLD